MIVNKNINPERDLYFLGGNVIEVLNSYTKNEIDFFDLFLSYTSIKGFKLCKNFLEPMSGFEPPTY